MHNIAELTVLLRARVDLPVGFRLARVDFEEGWDIVRSGGAQRLERKIEKRGWHFIKFEGSPVRSGVGETVDKAVASAVRIALRRVSAFFNAVEIQHIQITRYPWFSLARVIVNPYRIQQMPVASASDQYVPEVVRPRQRKWPEHGGDLYPQFACALPLLRQVLTSAQSQEARPQ